MNLLEKTNTPSIPHSKEVLSVFAKNILLIIALAITATSETQSQNQDHIDSTNTYEQIPKPEELKQYILSTNIEITPSIIQETNRDKAEIFPYVASMTLIGIIDGSRKAYHEDPELFEKIFNSDPISFFGSEAWKRQYTNNNPSLPYKSEIGTPFRDFWHLSRLVTKAGDYITYTLYITSKSNKKDNKILGITIMFATRTLMSHITEKTLLKISSK